MSEMLHMCIRLCSLYTNNNKQNNNTKTCIKNKKYRGGKQPMTFDLFFLFFLFATSMHTFMLWCGFINQNVAHSFFFLMVFFFLPYMFFCCCCFVNCKLKCTSLHLGTICQFFLDFIFATSLNIHVLVFI